MKEVLGSYEISRHAINEMSVRQIPSEIVKEIVLRPQQTYPQDDEIEIRQSIIEFEGQGNYLVRVFVNIKKNPNLVITVYRTSKINKYWK